MIFWLLAREVKILRGELGKSEDWDVMVDLFFYKELDKAIENEEEEEEGVKPEEGKTHGKEKAWDQQGEEVEEGGDWDAWERVENWNSLYVLKTRGWIFDQADYSMSLLKECHIQISV